MKTRPMLTLEDCERIMAAAGGGGGWHRGRVGGSARAEAARHGWIVAVAILDDGGHLLHFSRMDGATPANARIAIEKGRTAAESRRTTANWQERIKAGRPELIKMPGILPVQGGVPIVAEGVCVGGVGVSGVQSHEDEQIARAASDALQKS
jgi:glc operon protein GlcG